MKMEEDGDKDIQWHLLQVATLLVLYTDAPLQGVFHFLDCSDDHRRSRSSATV